MVLSLLPAATGRSCAVKCIPKRPHHGEATYEYLLRLRSEVEAMSQLGASLDAVNLQVRTRSTAPAWHPRLGPGAVADLAPAWSPGGV